MASRVDVTNPFGAPMARDALAPWNVTGADEISLYNVWTLSPLCVVLARGALYTTRQRFTEMRGSSACFL